MIQFGNFSLLHLVWPDCWASAGRCFHNKIHMVCSFKGVNNTAVVSSLRTGCNTAVRFIAAIVGVVYCSVVEGPDGANHSKVRDLGASHLTAESQVLAA